MSHLPDPYVQSEFYSYVVLKRFGAWVIDVLVITVILLITGIFTVGLAWFSGPYSLWRFLLSIGGSPLPANPPHGGC